MKSRPCGECTMCCRLIGIDKCNDGGDGDFPFDKPADVNCKHCRRGSGCEIFGTASLPRLCKVYSCLWKDPRFLPESWRPDRVNAICSAEGYFHERQVIRVITDKHEAISPQFSRWVDLCVSAGVAFVVQSGDRIKVISNSPELSQRISDTLRRGDR
jgi:hypothetical protein